MSARAVRPGALVACVGAGFALAAWSISAAGFEPMVRIARRLGAEGFAWYCCYSLGVFGLVGAAWLAAAGAPFERIGLFTWARIVREASADLLPFSQVGGLVVAARVLSARGFATTRVYASMIVDLATEIASQLVFTVAGLAGLLLLVADRGRLLPLAVPVGIGALLLAALAIGLMSAPAALRLGQRLVGRFGRHGGAQAAEVADALASLQQRRGRVAAAFALNLAAWISSAAGAWVVLRLMAADRPLELVLVLESIIFLLRSVAFAIPGGVGVQEVGYLVVGPLVGLPVEAALALAVAKRARDLAIAVPALVVWQAMEVRALLAPRRPMSRRRI